MKTLEYYWADGTHTVFDGYTIDKLSVVRNKKSHVMTRSKDGGYYRITLRHDGQQRKIIVSRAMASTFIGPPPTLQHTADHKDKNSLNDVLENIRWLCKPGQRLNQERPEDHKSAIIIVKDNMELTVKDWVKVYKKPNGEQYTTRTIREYAREQKHGFRYKDFPDLPGEEWKVVPDSKNSQGEWFISNMSRMKYKTTTTENVMGVDRLLKDNGYPVVGINGKHMRCHVLCMMTFRPEEYAIKRLDFIILHENDDKLDFRPSKLRWGTPPENTKDAHKNGKYDGTKSEQKSVASYINGVIEKEHDSLNDAARYMQENGYPDAYRKAVSRAIKNEVVRYGRTWAYV
ncbi:hypothetical protein ATCVMN08101_758R [Acanthocystis turfacea Chlorella virus MN0810.1]|nr:hypothetical protein ATCVMN08101_758R [Acanthocystis turfacea Chlorella virus MN0810.1]